MKNEAAVALGKLSVKRSPETHSQEHMTKLNRMIPKDHLKNLSRLGVEARRKKKEEAAKATSL